MKNEINQTIHEVQNFQFQLGWKRCYYSINLYRMIKIKKLVDEILEIGK